ncbi:MAG: hypothetical protein JWP44_2858 [Mucilaginibacter sp.]|nr:hypothetical protein [Mucilaginibacter sp.]
MKCRCLLVVLFGITLCFYACKKDTTVPQSTVSINGKWYLSAHHSKLYYNGVLLDSVFYHHFTTSDFIEYYSDGTGIISTNAIPSASLTSFKYTLSGLNLIQYISVTSKGLPEKITKLTKDSLSISYALLIIDSNSGNTDNETDEFNYVR